MKTILVLASPASHTEIPLMPRVRPAMLQTMRQP